MPRNRQQVPRAERADELVIAATELFLTKGYSGTTMVDIGTAAGVAAANVYWYFSSKDDVFAAVMDRTLGRQTRALEHELRDVDALSTLVRGLDDMRPFRGLHQSMHHRMPESAAVRAAHERLLSWIRTNINRVFDDDPSLTDRDMVVDMVVALFEGVNVSDAPQRTAKEMINFLMRSILLRKSISTR